MGQPLKLSRYRCVSRPFSAAILLVCFLFQLLLPVVVLGNEISPEEAFIEELRQSICLANQNSPRPIITENGPQTTSDFVCKWCVLHYVLTPTRPDENSTIVIYLPQDRQNPQWWMAPVFVADEFAGAKPQAPRAPPTFS